MTKQSFNILGSGVSKDVAGACESIEPKGSVTGTNPVRASLADLEPLLADKGDWILLDTALFSCGVTQQDAADASALAKFLKKNWGRRIVLICARPSAYRQGESALYRMPFSTDSVSESLAYSVAEATKAYCVPMPFDCVSRDGRPFHYIDVITKYVADVVGVIAEKYDRNAIDSLAMRCASEIGRMVEDTEAGTRALRKAYSEAAIEGKRDEACSVCAELVSRGDLEAAAISEHAFEMASRKGADVQARLGWLRSFAENGLGWAMPALFNILWRLRTDEADREMVDLVCQPAAEGDAVAMKLLSRAYASGRGVQADLDKSLNLAREAVRLRAPGARNDLFDVLWKVGTPEAYDEMVKAIKVPASIGVPGAVYRLGCAYRDGKGVEKDPEKARELMDSAAKKNAVYDRGLKNLG